MGVVEDGWGLFGIGVVLGGAGLKYAFQEDTEGGGLLLVFSGIGFIVLGLIKIMGAQS